MRTFEETKKFAYTHGLEKIYSLETVDIKTVRLVKTIPKKKARKLNFDPIPQQLDFDTWNTNHPLFAPIEVLSLSSSLVLLLEEKHLEKIVDVIENLNSLPETERLQIKTAIDRHLEKIPFLPGYRIHLRSWLKLKEEKPGQPITFGKELYLEGLKKCNKLFITPWALARGGLVRRYEINNYMRNLTQDPSCERILEELHKQFGMWEHILIPLEQDLFCTTAFVQKKFHFIMQIVKSYFYRPELRYPLDQLISYLVRETLFLPEEIEKILRLTSRYEIACGLKNQMEIYENN